MTPKTATPPAAPSSAAIPYSTELTAQGEQSVIPGCEANKSPKAKQLSLWG